MNLREPYQSGAVAAVIRDFRDHDAVLVKLPTGTGKTVVFTKVAEEHVAEHGGRVLILANRRELVEQAADKVRAFTDLSVGVEMAEQQADDGIWSRPSVVCASLQTLIADDFGKKRMDGFDPAQFSLVIIDECHGAVSASYGQVIEYFSSSKVLGVTATADRGDGKALGRVFGHVSYDYEIVDAINDGWLVPIKQQSKFIIDLDFTDVPDAGSDFNITELDKVMNYEKPLQEICRTMLEIVDGRKTLLFAVSVAHAEHMAEILNRYKPGCADWVCGKTPKDKRKELLGRFGSGDLQVMVNVGVLTEGYDEPAVEVVALARPTKSRSLYAQMIGRGTRPLPGVVDGHGGPDERKEAIAASGKPHLLVLDFVGNAGQHKLVTTADVLSGSMSDPVREKVAKKLQQGEMEVLELVAEAEEEARREQEEARTREHSRRAGLKGKAKFKSKFVDPFNLFDVAPARDMNWDTGKIPTPKMEAMLKKNGLNPDVLTFAEARQLVSEIVDRSNRGLCTFKQASLMRKFGYEPKDMTFAMAQRITITLSGRSWKRLPDWHELSPTSLAGTARQHATK